MHTWKYVHVCLLKRWQCSKEVYMNGIMLEMITKMVYSHVGYIALLWKLAFCAKVGAAIEAAITWYKLQSAKNYLKKKIQTYFINYLFILSFTMYLYLFVQHIGNWTNCNLEFIILWKFITCTNPYAKLYKIYEINKKYRYHNINYHF